MDVQQARALVAPYAESDAWESPAVLAKFAQGHRVDFGEFLETLLTLAHRFGVESQTDVEELVEWAPEAPPGTWLPDASDALAAVLTLISDWENGLKVPEGYRPEDAAVFAEILSSAVEASGEEGS